MVFVRSAKPQDADACSVILRDSIRALCLADHRGDAGIVDDWIANKTPAHVRRWIADSRLTVFVAERDGSLSGVGAVNDVGEIVLNYVSPAHRFAGVSKALLVAMEGALKKNGIRTARLTSTETARRFYRSAGWTDAGAPESKFGIDGYPMEKRL
jgi:GNAT superfamily N-acetyltransferase